MTAPARLATVYATDEDIVSVAGADFSELASKSARLALGADGYFDVPTPWVLSSPSVDFLGNGVASNQVVQLTGARTHFAGGGELLAVDEATESSITLRWPGQPLNQGHPPGYGGVTGVKFEIRTLAAQIENACFEINERFAIDPANTWRAPDRVYDLRILRDLTVYAVLYRAYANQVRDEKGDWRLKVAQYKSEYDDALARATVRWGPRGTDQPPTNRFGTRLGR